MRATLLVLSAAMVASCGDDDDPTGVDAGGNCDITRATTVITVGQTANGTLTNNDCRLDDDTYADVYRLTLSATRVLQIDMASNSFDTYLILYDANGQELSRDDDSGGGIDGTNSRLSGTLPPGVYYIAANAFEVGATGSYTLRVQ